MINNPRISAHDDVQRIPLNTRAYQDFLAGDIVEMDFGDEPYSMLSGEQIGRRPVIILKSNRSSKCPLLQIVKLSKRMNKHSKWHIPVDSVKRFEGSMALIEHNGAYSRERVMTKVLGNVGEETLKQIKETLNRYMAEDK